MSQATISHRPIVNYIGSIKDMHGLWSVVETGERLTLRSAYGLTLRYVRRASVKAVDVPRLTRYRADALRVLAGHRGRIPTRARNWLVAQGLAELDEAGEPRVTGLGFELAAALPRHF